MRFIGCKLAFNMGKVWHHILSFLNKDGKLAFYLLPLVIISSFFIWKSTEYPLHDYSNSYFPARLVTEGLAPEDKVLDIYEFNQYAWNKGYTEVLMDFYLNSPFTSTFFYPFALLDDAYLSKLLFNLLSVALCIIGVYLLAGRFLPVHQYKFLALVPILFLLPFRNHIFYGQSYMISFFLIVTSFRALEMQRKPLGISLLGLAAFIKVMPAFYAVTLLFNKQWKTIAYGVIAALVLFLVSFTATGITFWEVYIFEVLPNAILNESTIDFRPNYQSLEVFLKTIFVFDAYYNPNAISDSPTTYKVLLYLFKSVTIGAALQLSFMNRNDLFKLLSIWVVAFFLIQSRTANYAQILWLIPLFVFLGESISNGRKITFMLVLLLICNFPFHWLQGFPIPFIFMRLWLSILLGVIFFLGMSKALSLRHIGMALIVLLPLNLGVFKSFGASTNHGLHSEYVIEEKTAFMVSDYFEKDGHLNYIALGINGKIIETIETAISIESYDSTSCHILNNQVYLGEKQLTDDHALKKKPVLINDAQVYFLTDHHSRRGAFTLKKIDLSKWRKDEVLP